MSVVSIGDMAQQFTSLRSSHRIKSELAVQLQRLSTGQVEDITKQLNGETARFSGIGYSLTQLDGYSQIASETQQYLANIQTILTQVDSTRSATAERLLLVSDSSTIAQVDEAALSASSAFETIVRSLNTQIADRSLLGGARVDTAPLIAAETMMSEIIAAVGATQDVAGITAIVDAWFDDPAGGFTTIGYSGDTGPALQKRTSETMSFEMIARADDAAIKEVLKGTAIAALSNALPGLDRQTKSDLLQDAGAVLFASASDLVALQARVGFTEAGVARSISETNAQQTALRIARNDLVQADPFETAVKLQEVQLQLETHFAVTARMAELSLLRFI